MKKYSLVWSCVFFILFFVLIVLVRAVDVAPVGPADTSVGLSSVNLAVHSGVGMHSALYKLTQITGYLAILLAACFAAFGGFQLIQSRSVRKVDGCLLRLAALYAAVLVIYVLFEKVIVNYRPVLMEGETVPEASFPSSHTMLACTIYLSASMILDRYVKNPRLAVVLRALCVALAVITVLGRFASGVHWFTDILGGVLISGALLCCFSAFLPAAESENDVTR
ncbi:MAG: phosphatase PAP2 family protein [Clostridia bacterium]|nr:phosphatase PAP2 family protein [Clostridia bacterium]